MQARLHFTAISKNYLLLKFHGQQAIDQISIFDCSFSIAYADSQVLIQLMGSEVVLRQDSQEWVLIWGPVYHLKHQGGDRYLMRGQCSGVLQGLKNNTTSKIWPAAAKAKQLQRLVDGLTIRPTLNWWAIPPPNHQPFYYQPWGHYFAYFKKLLAGYHFVECLDTQHTVVIFSHMRECQVVSQEPINKYLMKIEYHAKPQGTLLFMSLTKPLLKAGTVIRWEEDRATPQTWLVTSVKHHYDGSCYQQQVMAVSTTHLLKELESECRLHCLVARIVAIYKDKHYGVTIGESKVQVSGVVKMRSSQQAGISVCYQAGDWVLIAPLDQTGQRWVIVGALAYKNTLGFSDDQYCIASTQSLTAVLDEGGDKKTFSFNVKEQQLIFDFRQSLLQMTVNGVVLQSKQSIKYDTQHSLNIESQKGVNLKSSGPIFFKAQSIALTGNKNIKITSQQMINWMSQQTIVFKADLLKFSAQQSFYASVNTMTARAQNIKLNADQKLSVQSKRVFLKTAGCKLLIAANMTIQ